MRRETLFGLAVLAAFAANRASAQVVNGRESWRPPALEVTETCDVWFGGGTGNDPTKLLELQVCNADGAREKPITGQYQISSNVAGWSVRDIQGAWNPEHTEIVLRELRMTVDQPKPGWRFCKCDVVRLRPSGDKMTGSYDSEDCNDHGELTLTRVKSFDKVDPASGPRRRDAHGGVALVPRLAPQREASGCAVGVNGGATPVGALAFVVAAAFARMRRRK